MSLSAFVRKNVLFIAPTSPFFIDQIKGVVSGPNSIGKEYEAIHDDFWEEKRGTIGGNKVGFARIYACASWFPTHTPSPSA